MTDGAFRVRLERPIRGVALNTAGDSTPLPRPEPVPDNGVTAVAENDAWESASLPPELLAGLEQQQNQLLQARRSLDDLLAKLARFQEDMLSTHRREIARLAVEIARKVLMQEVKDNDYEIEGIIQEALKNAPVQQDVVVHLHPEDLLTCQALQQDGPEGPFAQLHLVGDPAVGKAECLLETPKGVVKSFIDDHLDKIREALERAN